MTEFLYEITSICLTFSLPTHFCMWTRSGRIFSGFGFLRKISTEEYVSGVIGKTIIIESIFFQMKVYYGELYLPALFENDQKSNKKKVFQLKVRSNIKI